MKLIHSGKVLKDGDTISACGIKPNDFLVVMITKAKKPAAAAATAAAAPAAAASAGAAASTAGEGTAGAAAAPTTPAPATAAEAASVPPAAAASSTAAPGAPARGAAPEGPPLSAAAVEGLVGMGFPEAEVRHCLRAAGGNPDVAVEFLTQGIPDAVSAALASSSASSSPAAAAAGASSPGSSAPRQPLQALREHPQFDALRRLVQSNPAMLQQVLTQIGQQQPELLREINDNQALFLEMMNEPVSEASAAAPSSSGAGRPAAGSSSSAAARGAAPGGPFGPGGVLGSPAQMAALIQSMGDDEIQQMAGMMGLTVDQLRQTANLIGSLPEAELNQFMMQAMGGGGAGEMDDLMGGFGGGGAGGGAGGGMGGPQVVHLTEDEMAAVDRLTEMGFDRSEAAQAFLACDKNEALAANLLMDSMGEGGGFFGGGGGGGHGDDDQDGGGGGDQNNNDGQGDMEDDQDDMYD
jgi:UV excision repair protein RAD23